MPKTNEQLETDIEKLKIEIEKFKETPESKIEPKHNHAGGDYARVNMKDLTGVVWDDLRIPGLQVKVGATAPDLISFLGSGDLKIYGFNGAATTEIVYFAIQLPHSYQQGAEVIPHIHWSPTNTDSGNVKWQLEYSWANFENDTYGSPTTISIIDAASEVAWKHQVANFPAISGTGKRISSILICRLFRDPSDGSDTYGSDAAFLEFDFHFPINSIGSTDIESKY